MFNLSSPTNIRCNGVVKNMPPAIGRLQRSQVPHVAEDNNKFLDHIIMGTSAIPSPPLTVKQESFDDPYTFNDSEIQLNNKKCNIKENFVITPAKNLNYNKEKFSKSDIINSIIDVSETKSRKTTKPVPTHLKTRRINFKATHHEALQRIRKKWHAPTLQHLSETFSSSDSEDELISRNIFNYQELVLKDCFELRDREFLIQRNRERIQRLLLQKEQELSHVDSHCDRTLNLINAMRGKQFNYIGNIILQKHPKKYPSSFRSSNAGLIPPRQCSFDGESGPCKRVAVPCTRHCSRHIMNNSDQLLYDYCTAKFADNTQCCIPVFDLNHELPLCIEHARKRDNYNKMCQVVKPKKPRKKVKPSAMIRPQKRSKKRRRPPTVKPSRNPDSSVADNSSACDSSDDLGMVSITENSEFGGDDDDELVSQVLGVAEEELPLELSGPTEALVTQASRLLEETDLTTVFNQIPPDAFNDLFAIDRNGVYEPTREETEELERALEAVNQDVKSLEKMSQTQGILDSLLDEHALVESLAQMPDVFSNLNGFATSASSSIPNRPIHALENIMSLQSSAHMPS